MIGNVHKILRFDIARDFAGLLDREALKPETRVLIEEMDALLASYRERVKATREFAQETQNGKVVTVLKTPPSYTRVPQAELQAFEHKADALLEKLQHSELAIADTIPLHFGDEQIKVPNSDSLGLFLWGLEVSRHGEADKNIIPSLKMQTWQFKFIGNKQGTTNNMDARLKPLSPEFYEAVYAKNRDKILDEVRHAARPLQLQHLLSHNDKQGIEYLLDKIGVPANPSALETPLECALMLADIRKVLSMAYTIYESSRPMEAERITEAMRLAGQLLQHEIAVIDGKRNLPDSKLLKRTRKALSALDIPDMGAYPDYDAKTAIKLVNGFLEQQEHTVMARKHGR